MILKNQDFIIVGQQPWDYPAGSNCINIAEEISKNNRVLYINPPTDWITILRKHEEEQYILKRRQDILSGQRPNLQQVNENLYVFSPVKAIASINMLPDGALYDFFNKKNNRKYASEIKKAIAEIGINDFILFNDGDMLRSFYLTNFLKPILSVYYSRDYFRAVEYWKKHGSRLEPELMAKVDLVVSNSIYLDSLSGEFNDNTAYIGQGCDFTLFDPEKVNEVPQDLDKIPHPRIGYIGALLNLRLDISLLENIARKKPDWQIVLIGPEDEHFKNSDLHQMQNVHFLGPRPMDSLADYLQGFDVAINPQKFNEVTIGNYPRKIDEYLAMGIPTVATYTETMTAFKEHVHLAEGLDSYIEHIELALTEDSEEFKESRRAFALNHTWENSVNAMYEAILKTPAYNGNKG